MTKRKPKTEAPEQARHRPTKSAEATEQQRVNIESRERREAEMAALLRQVGAARAQRDSAVAALEVIAAECPGAESPNERAYRLLASSALARVHSLGRTPLAPATAIAEGARFDG